MQQPAAVDGGCRRGEKWWSLHGAEGCGGAGQVFSSLQRCLLPQQGSATQGAKPRWLQALVHPRTCPCFFQLLCTCLCFFSLHCWRALHPFMKIWCTQKNKPGSKQAAKAAQKKAPPAAQKYQALPTRLFPHPPHQWEAQWPSTALCPSASPSTQASGKENSQLRRKQGKLPVLAPQELQPQSFPSSFCKEDEEKKQYPAMADLKLGSPGESNFTCEVIAS